MILELDSHAHSRIDPLFDAWTIDWVQHALRHPSELFQANIFAPERDTLAYSHAQLGTGVLLLPARWIGLSPIGVLNVGLLAGFTLSAASAYLFGRVATGSRVVAVIAGLAYSFGPVGTAQAGHLFMVMRPGPPLAAAAVWWLADRAKRSASLWLPAAALAATLAWQASNSFYLTAYTVVVALVVAAVRFRSFGRRGFAYLAGGAAGGGVVVALMAIPYLRVRDRFPGIEWTLDGISAFGAHFTEVDYRDRLWAPLLGAPTGSAAEKAFPGLVVLGFAVCALVVARRMAPKLRPAVWAGLALTVVGFLMAIGASDSGWRRYTPYRLVFEIVPGFTALRDTGRAWIIGMLGLGLLAGLGVAWLRERLEQASSPALVRAGAVTVILPLVALLMVAEGLTAWQDSFEVRERPVDAALAELDEPGGVLYLPMNYTRSRSPDIGVFLQPTLIYGTTAHHRPTPNGYSGFSPPSYARMARDTFDLPDERVLDELRDRGVRFVVVTSYADDVAELARLRDPANAAPLELVGRYGPDVLYRIPDR